MQLRLAEDSGRFEHHDLEPFRLAMFDKRGQCRPETRRRYQNPLSDRFIRRMGESTTSENKQGQHGSQSAPRENNQSHEAQEHKAHVPRIVSRARRRASFNPEAEWLDDGALTDAGQALIEQRCRDLEANPPPPVPRGGAQARTLPPFAALA